MQQHENEDIYKLAFEIIDQYFSGDDVSMLKMEEYMYCAVSLVTTLSLFLSSSGHEHTLSSKFSWSWFSTISLNLKSLKSFSILGLLFSKIKRTGLVLPNKLIDADLILSH